MPRSEHKITKSVVAVMRHMEKKGYSHGGNRVFGGQTQKQISESLNVSLPTIVSAFRVLRYYEFITFLSKKKSQGKMAPARWKLNVTADHVEDLYESRSEEKKDLSAQRLERKNRRKREGRKVHRLSNPTDPNVVSGNRVVPSFSVTGCPMPPQYDASKWVVSRYDGEIESEPESNDESQSLVEDPVSSDYNELVESIAGTTTYNLTHLCKKTMRLERNHHGEDSMLSAMQAISRLPEGNVFRCLDGVLELLAVDEDNLSRDDIDREEHEHRDSDIRRLRLYEATGF